MKVNTAIVIGLVVFQAMLAVVVIASPESLGLTSVVVNWMAILNVGCGVFLNQLEKFGGSARQVETVTTETAVPGHAPVVSTVETVTETAKSPPSVEL